MFENPDSDNILCGPCRVGCLCDICYALQLNPVSTWNMSPFFLYAAWVFKIYMEEMPQPSGFSGSCRSKIRSNKTQASWEVKKLKFPTRLQRRSTATPKAEPPRAKSDISFYGEGFEYSCLLWEVFWIFMVFLESGETFRACLLICTGIKWALLEQ